MRKLARTIATAIAVLACLLVGVTDVALAQTAAHPRLRVVVRDGTGAPLSGVVVKLYFVDDLTEHPSQVAAAETDERGILDYDISRWQVGAYRVRLAAGASEREVEDVNAQGREYPPLELRLAKSGDEWLMLVLLDGGRVTPDFSYSLSKSPVIQRGVPPTDKPVSYSQLLQENGLPVMLPYEKDYRPGATVTPLGDVTPIATSNPTPMQAGKQASGQSGALDSIATLVIALVALFLYIFRGRLGGWFASLLTKFRKEESSEEQV